MRLPNMETIFILLSPGRIEKKLSNLLKGDSDEIWRNDFRTE